jgi:hypothetical protein
MEPDNKKKIKFIKSDSPEQESLVISLLNSDSNQSLEIKDPNMMINNLEFVVDKSFTRGSFGDFHLCYDEYIIKNSPLSVLLILIRDRKFLSEFLKAQKITIFNGEYAQYFSTFEGKDSNRVVRYTFNNFHLGHLMVGCGRDDTSFQKYLTPEETCGEFEVQHKSAQYMSRSDDKYSQGFKEKITNCTLKEMRELDKKIEDMSEYKHLKNTTSKKKSKK